jgi:transposase InsO family protein
MFSFLKYIVEFIFNLRKSRKDLLIQITVLQKEVEILKRSNGQNRLRIKKADRVILAILNSISHIKEKLTIVKPETVLRWQKELIKSFWTFKRKKQPGRPSISHEIRQLILAMKNDNLYWGLKKIQGELLKLGIHVDKKTIRNILNGYRRKGKVKQSLTWKQFLNVQAHSIYAMDFFTIDTILNQRYYVFFIIHHKSRVIAQFSITQNPCREFVRQQLIEFSDKLKNSVYIIHDNAAQFHLNFLHFGLKDIGISVNAPNMNSYAERFVGSVRREALNFFLLLSEKQIRGILTEYIEYYNALRPHQGIDQNIPQGYKPQYSKKVRKIPILGGICYHYESHAA